MLICHELVREWIMSFFAPQKNESFRSAKERLLAEATEQEVPVRDAEESPFAERKATMAWADLAWIAGNWACALLLTGNLVPARQRQLESPHAEKNAGRPAIDVIVSELEALRIDIMQGQAAAALPRVAAAGRRSRRGWRGSRRGWPRGGRVVPQVARVAAWWQRHRSGQSVPEGPDADCLQLFQNKPVKLRSENPRVAFRSAKGRFLSRSERRQCHRRQCHRRQCHRRQQKKVTIGRSGHAR